MHYSLVGVGDGMCIEVAGGAATVAVEDFPCFFFVEVAGGVAVVAAEDFPCFFLGQSSTIIQNKLVVH